MSQFGIEIAEMTLVWDLCKSVLKYIDNSDKVIEFSASTGNKGNFEINAQISRKGEQFLFSTEAILAGGYNVQCLHVRYIVRTDLPTINNLSFAQEIKKAITFKNKIESKKNEISRFKKQQSELKITITELKKKTRNEVIEELKSNGKILIKKEWNVVDLPWFKSQEDYNVWIEKSNEETIQYKIVTELKFKEQRLEGIKGWIKTAEKQLAKIKANK